MPDDELIGSARAGEAPPPAVPAHIAGHVAAAPAPAPAAAPSAGYTALAGRVPASGYNKGGVVGDTKPRYKGTIHKNG